MPVIRKTTSSLRPRLSASRALPAPKAASRKSARPTDLFEATRATRSSLSGAKASSGGAFIQRFETSLGLSASSLSQRQAFMKTSAFSLFRANPSLFHYDLAHDFKQDATLLPRAAPQMTVVGDAHVFNLGTFRASGGKAVWGLNDFDQALRGSPEADLNRLGASLVLAGREARLSEKASRSLVEAAGKAYAGEVKRLAKNGKEPGAFLVKKQAEGEVKALIAKADGRDRKEGLAKLGVKDGRFERTDELKKVSDSLRQALTSSLTGYAKQLPADARVKLPLQVMDTVEKLGSGGSSLGLPRYWVLVKAAKEGRAPVALELKLPPPVPTGQLPRSGAPADAPSIVQSHRTLGGLENPLTGSAQLEGASYLVRELEPEKDRLEARPGMGADEFRQMATQAAVVLARAHAQSGGAGPLARWIGSDVEPLTQALTAFSTRYADRTEQDFKALRGGH